MKQTPDCLDTLIQAYAGRAPERLAVCFPKTKAAYTCAQLEAKTAAIGARADALKARDGHIICILFEDAERTALHLIGLLRAGFCPLPLDPANSDKSLAEVVRFVGPAGILADAGDSRPGRLLSDPATPAREHKVAFWATANPSTDRPENPCVLMPTSGTTGKPKIVQIPESGILHNARAVGCSLKLGIDDVFLSLTPPYYCHGFYNGVLMPLVLGASTVVLDRFDAFAAANFWAIASGHAVSVVNAVPTTLEMLMGINFPNYMKPDALRLFICGTARLASPRKAAFEERFGVPIATQFGMTESLINTVNTNPAKADSQGVPVGCSISIESKDGSCQPAGTIGELTIEGPSLTPGYYRSPEMTAAALDGGRLHSGDLAYLDSEGYVHIVGRVKEMINKGGVKVYPQEVSDAFLCDPRVREVCTVGVPEPRYGEEIVTFIVPKTPLKISIPELVALARQRLPAAKIPGRIILVPSVPKGPTGKPSLPELRRLAVEHRGED